MANNIHGIEGLTPGELRHQIDLGGRFVYYKYVISVLVLTFRRSSGVYFVRPGENRTVKGLGWTALTFFLGWWGIPWGPIWSIASIYTNLAGGEDVTGKVVGALGLNNAPANPGTPPPLPGMR